jgi:hypothetical protein
MDKITLMFNETKDAFNRKASEVLSEKTKRPIKVLAMERNLFDCNFELVPERIATLTIYCDHKGNMELFLSRNSFIISTSEYKFDKTNFLSYFPTGWMPVKCFEFIDFLLNDNAIVAQTFDNKPKSLKEHSLKEVYHRDKAKIMSLLA